MMDMMNTVLTRLDSLQEQLKKLEQRKPAIEIEITASDTATLIDAMKQLHNNFCACNLSIKAQLFTERAVHNELPD